MRGLGHIRLSALLAAVALLVAACGAGGRDDDASGADQKLPTRTIESGAVTVRITPIQLDASGAAFKVVLDTHAVDLDLDVAGSAQLVVDGTQWTAASWDGAGPGGHHREGTLRFDAAADPTGTAEVSISGLPKPVRATWTLKGG